jgi:hypothetical protein
MAETKSINAGSFDPMSAYAQSFGNLGHKTVYFDPMTKSMDMRAELYDKFEVGLKAHMSTSGGAGTAGYAMIPVFVDPVIIDRSRKWTPIVEMIPRVTNQGMYADYNVITAKGGAYTAAENSALSETNTTYDRASTAIKFLYAVGAVSGPSQVAQPSYILQGFISSGQAGAFSNQTGSNAKQQEVLVKTREIKELEENLIINGNSTTSGISGNPNGTEFDGIITLMSTTNTVAKGTTAVSLKDLYLAVRYAFDDGGRPNLAVCSSGVYDDIEQLLHEKMGYIQPQKEFFWGFNAIYLKTLVGDIPVVPSMYMSNTTGSKAIYFLDLSVVEMRVLQDLTYFDLAKTNDADRFALKIYEALIIRATTFCASVTAIA